MAAERILPYVPRLVPGSPQSVSEAYQTYQGMDLDSLRRITTLTTATMLDIVVVRFGAGLAINEEKQKLDLPVLDSVREAEVLAGVELRGERLGLRSEFSSSLIQSVMEECRWLQEQARG
jgi:chorismate mutase